MKAFQAAAILLASVLMVSPSEATAPPAGSYANSCVDIDVVTLLGGSGTSLTASCQTRSNSYVNAALPLPCRGDIQNRNGALVCVAGSNPYAPPRGSYMARCRKVNMAGPILQADCMTVLMTYVRTSINVLTCKGRDIAVGPRGRLFC